LVRKFVESLADPRKWPSGGFEDLQSKFPNGIRTTEELVLAFRDRHICLENTRIPGIGRATFNVLRRALELEDSSDRRVMLRVRGFNDTAAPPRRLLSFV